MANEETIRRSARARAAARRGRAGATRRAGRRRSARRRPAASAARRRARRPACRRAAPATVAARRRCRGRAPARRPRHELQQRALALVASRIAVRARKVAPRELLGPPLLCRHPVRMNMSVEWVRRQRAPDPNTRPHPRRRSGWAARAAHAYARQARRVVRRDPPADRLPALELHELGDQRRVGLAAVQPGLALRSPLQRAAMGPGPHARRPARAAPERGQRRAGRFAQGTADVCGATRS